MPGHSRNNPLADPAYLRRESRRLHRIIKILTDPEIRKALAAHAFHLAQQAEAIGRMAADSADIGTHDERHQPPPATNFNDGERRTVNDPPAQPEQALDGTRTLRDLANWYRCYAERAGNPVIWEARLQMALDLEAEADGIERRDRHPDPDQGGGSAAG